MCIGESSPLPLETYYNFCTVIRYRPRRTHKPCSAKSIYLAGFHTVLADFHDLRLQASPSRSRNVATLFAVFLLYSQKSHSTFFEMHCCNESTGVAGSLPLSLSRKHSKAAVSDNGVNNTFNNELRRLGNVTQKRWFLLISGHGGGPTTPVDSLKHCILQVKQIQYKDLRQKRFLQIKMVVLRLLSSEFVFSRRSRAGMFDLWGVLRRYASEHASRAT